MIPARYKVNADWAASASGNLTSSLLWAKDIPAGETVLSEWEQARSRANIEFPVAKDAVEKIREIIASNASANINNTEDNSYLKQAQKAVSDLEEFFKSYNEARQFWADRLAKFAVESTKEAVTLAQSTAVVVQELSNDVAVLAQGLDVVASYTVMPEAVRVALKSQLGEIVAARTKAANEIVGIINGIAALTNKLDAQTLPPIIDDEIALAVKPGIPKWIYWAGAGVLFLFLFFFSGNKK